MISKLYAQSAEPSKATVILMNLFPFILIFAIFYLLLIRPQKKKQQKHQSMLNDLKPADKVLLNSGIYGKIIKLKDERKCVVEIAPTVEVEVDKSYIVSLIKE